MKKKVRFEEEHDHEEDIEEHKEEHAGGYVKLPEMRLVSLYGDVDEKKASELVYSLIACSRIKNLTPLDKKDPPEKFSERTDPVEFLISTPGGSASDMFSIYDTMKMVQKEMEIHTIGMGKVMSAGVLLLASRN